MLGQLADLGVVAHEHVPVQRLLARLGVAAPGPAVSHLLGQCHPASLACDDSAASVKGWIWCLIPAASALSWCLPSASWVSRSASHPVTVASIPQVVRLAAALDHFKPGLGDVAMVLAFTGLRWEEAGIVS